MLHASAAKGLLPYASPMFWMSGPADGREWLTHCNANPRKKFRGRLKPRLIEIRFGEAVLLGEMR